MTTDNILDLALEAEFGYLRFAELLEAKVRADEREACAALCREVAAGRDAEAIEEAILARGEK